MRGSEGRQPRSRRTAPPAAQRNPLLDPPSAARERAGKARTNEGWRVAAEKTKGRRGKRPERSACPAAARCLCSGTRLPPPPSCGEGERRLPSWGGPVRGGPRCRLLGCGLRSRALPPALPQRRPAGGPSSGGAALKCLRRPSWSGSAAVGNCLEKAAAVLHSAVSAQVFLVL